MEDTSFVANRKSLASVLNVGCNGVVVAHRPLVVGHRGSLFEEVENTLPSFQAAIDAGCDAFELDVWLLKCGTLVVFHGGGSDDAPGWLEDYCGVRASILDFTYQEAKALRFNPQCKELSVSISCGTKIHSATIPTLNQVLELAKQTGVSVKIELKGPNTEEPTLELVERMNMVRQVSFSSFAHDRVAKIRMLRHHRTESGQYMYKTACLFSDSLPTNFVDISKSVGACEVHLKYDTCTKERIDAIHKAGMDSMAWFCGPEHMRKETASKYSDVGNEDAEMYGILLQTGVRSLCVNRPNVLLSLLNTKH
mmetsp:Transcript_4271/g.6323  ORF Transcript_4271/g.6323 Transcript_4271/m.6323 type:complete len:309 (-) Transcript_4271:71-997(-)|eukprot:CAMPEP_0172431990 /NCGR_PEP_ID=MMETSP1064-20121228/60975_1 /TAXON_ID=202472 /ORGANISM="Aulacoseira subarctica , Strain CCAP 1002/5" /LENGTH=308 /DNA_ID=CAMNT_0013179011 /DNA_START=96 /DNA_END=1022 /DNA_ORIENTATION=+